MSRASGILKHSMGAALATLLSRILGLARTMLEARVLGGGFVASAWQLAFMIPNMFRRLLGEGALSAALIPIISATEEFRDRNAAKKQIAAVMAVLSGILGVLVILGSLASWLFERYLPWDPAGKYGYVQYALRLLVLLMPYAFFMCLVGVSASLLNLRKVFFLPAAGSLIMNAFTIAALVFFAWRGGEWYLILETLSYAVLASGVVNLLFLFVLLKRYDIAPVFKGFWHERKVLGELGKLMLPGLVGYSVLQLSFLVDSILAASLGPQAVPAINYSNRIIDLPIGIYALSLGAVLLPAMSRSAARGNFSEMQDDLNFGLRNVIFCGVPIAVFSIIFGGLIVTSLCYGGKFNQSDLEHTTYTMMAYALGIPFFCMVKILQPAFYARKEMVKPMYSSMVCVGVNIVLSIILMRFWSQQGIALATVAASGLNNAILLYWLWRDGIKAEIKNLFWAFGRSLLLSLFAALGMFFLLMFAERYFQASSDWIRSWGTMAHDWTVLLLAAGGFTVLYFFGAWLVGAKECRECVAPLLSKFNRRPKLQ